MEEIPPYRYPPENSYVPQNRDHFKRTFHLNQPSIFRGYASFQEVYRSKKPSLDCTLPINCLCYPPESASEEIQRPAQDVQMRPLTKKKTSHDSSLDFGFPFGVAFVKYVAGSKLEHPLIQRKSRSKKYSKVSKVITQLIFKQTTLVTNES